MKRTVIHNLMIIDSIGSCSDPIFHACTKKYRQSSIKKNEAINVSSDNIIRTSYTKTEWGIQRGGLVLDPHSAHIGDFSLYLFEYELFPK
jgi:hypothetical protein